MNMKYKATMFYSANVIFVVLMGIVLNSILIQFFDIVNFIGDSIELKEFLGVFLRPPF